MDTNHKIQGLREEKQLFEQKTQHELKGPARCPCLSLPTIWGLANIIPPCIYEASVFLDSALGSGLTSQLICPKQSELSRKQI